MPRITATEVGLRPHFQVEAVFGDATIHLASWHEPNIEIVDGWIGNVEADWIEHHDYGDTIGYIDWTAVATVSWRWSP